MTLPTPYYQDESCTIYCADCREILPLLPKVDLVLTDPPYCVSVAGAKYDSGRGIRNLDFFPGDSDWQQMRKTVLDAILNSADRLTNEGSLYAWVGHRSFGDLVDALENVGFKTRFLVWTKECPPPAPPNSGWQMAFVLDD